ncbi:class I adenylate-forming enzyme family protein [Methanolobus halotolerans]|uniref:Long-chain fatty acid--CoA ligase n=1 Tax=Methanolobus halotolerans TaxID=2052935 RepID=A0A4E0PTT4_9EURY|nr:class I adenylate-forming enzyme family protein [Methanolobus halotolerans]TGC08307.1 long-chain fatty acid--CoA ligase [Methanolobus halotolerans]
MRIDSFITRTAKEDPGKIALEEGEKTISYGFLDKDIGRIASSMMEFGHCRFAVLAESGIQYIEMLMAVYRSDNIAIPLPIELAMFSLEHILDTGNIRHIIVTEVQYTRFGESFFDRFATVIVVSEDGSVNTLHKMILEESNDPHLRLVLYTSGTTGNPKGVMLSDRNLVANADSIIEVLGIKPDDKAALVISPHHAFGNSIIDSHLVVGGSIRIGSMSFIGSVFSMMKSGVSMFYGVPSTYRLLLRYPAKFKQAFMNIKVAATAGGAIDDIIVKNLKGSNRDLRVVPMYGQTEATARLAYLPSEDVDKFVDSIGKAIPGVTLDVFDADGCSVGPNITGELVASGDNIMLGYLDDEIATGKKIINGWMHTGDLAEKLPNGYFRLLGRKDDIIKIGDHRINPRELERYIQKNIDVSGVFVVPVPHNILGNAICLMVMPNSSTDVASVLSFCRKNLPGYLCPLEVLCIDQLPLSENGKISNRSIIEGYRNVKNSM